jgi:hypothetical protein
MPDAAQAIAFVLVLAAVAVAAGIGFGRVIAPRIGRLAERADAEDEEPGDGTD